MSQTTSLADKSSTLFLFACGLTIAKFGMGFSKNDGDTLTFRAADISVARIGLLQIQGFGQARVNSAF